MQPSTSAGKNYVLIISITCVMFTLISSMITMLATGFRGIGTDLVRLALTLGLCYFLCQGHRWARWVAGILFSLGGVVGVVSGIALLPETPLAILLVIMGGAYLGFVGVLFFVPSVRAFFQPQG